MNPAGGVYTNDPFALSVTVPWSGCVALVAVRPSSWVIPAAFPGLIRMLYDVTALKSVAAARGAAVRHHSPVTAISVTDRAMVE